MQNISTKSLSNGDENPNLLWDVVAQSYAKEDFFTAKNVCLKILDANPRHASALHMLGVLKSRDLQWDDAAKCIDGAIEIDSSNGEYWRNRGLVHLSLSQLSEAKRCLEMALMLNSSDFLAMNSLAPLLRTLGELQQSLQMYLRALQCAPENAKSSLESDLGLVFTEIGDYTAAERHLHHSLKLNPIHVPAYFNLGVCYRAQNLNEKSEIAYLHAIALDNQFFPALVNLGNLMSDMGRVDEAETWLRRALSLEPSNPLAFINLGQVLISKQEFEEAELLFTRALGDSAHFRNAKAIGMNYFKNKNFELAIKYLSIALEGDPDDGVIANDLGVAHLNLGNFELANQLFERAKASCSASNEVKINAAVALENLGLHGEASLELEEVVATRGEICEALWNRALLDLKRGNFSRGWEGFEVRLQMPFFNQGEEMKFPFPSWNGESLGGRRILLVAEQGVGDQIQFIRFAKVISDMGASFVGILARENVAQLFSRIQGVRAVHVSCWRQTDVDYDFWAYMLSVPRLLNISEQTIPAALPYISAREDILNKWVERLAKVKNGLPAIGIVWAGNPEHSADKFRSMRLDQLLPLIGLNQYQWFSLQKGSGSEQVRNVANIIDIADGLETYEDTVAAIECLDLVITVDTSVAHLAGALNKRVWVMLAANPDWRWMLNRGDSPWYPKVMRLFRQEKQGEWGSVITRIREKLTVGATYFV